MSIAHLIIFLNLMDFQLETRYIMLIITHDDCIKFINIWNSLLMSYLIC